MMRKHYALNVILLFALVALLHGCAINRATATVDQTTDLTALKVFYVKNIAKIPGIQMS